MRPRVKSYGESSTATLSPARMRIKFLRILPETCARTWCLFSSSTRNMAFGSGSITVAITSMASSLELPESPFFFSSLNCFAIVSYFVPLTTTGQLHLWASSKSKGRSRLPPRCARNAPRGCHPLFPPPTHRPCQLPDVPHSPSARPPWPALPPPPPPPPPPPHSAACTPTST